MINFRALKKKYFKSTEEIVSMFLGLVIVVVVIGLIFNFFQKRKGNVEIPGVSNVKISEDIDKPEESVQNINQGEYTVVRGDNLWKIAQKEYSNGYQWVKIAKANNLKNPSVISTGQKLILPSIGQSTANTLNTNSKSNSISVGSDYKVVKGDNLWKIAVRAYGDGYNWVKIWRENKSKLKSPNGLAIGMILTIPKLE